MITLPQGISLAIKLVTAEITELKQKNLTIALDGHSSSGKSTLAKDLAKLLDIIHVDSGAMYRAVTYSFIQNDIDFTDDVQLSKALNDIHIEFKMVEQMKCTFLNGVNVESAIREMAVSDKVSEVATIHSVRKFLVAQQRAMAKKTSIIMDGRDIGTVVFPDADVKLFVTADISERSKRRFKELQGRGKDISLSDVSKNLEKRDIIDSTREHSPLVKAGDAVTLDTTNLDRGTMLAEAIKIIHSRVKS